MVLSLFDVNDLRAPSGNNPLAKAFTSSFSTLTILHNGRLSIQQLPRTQRLQMRLHILRLKPMILGRRMVTIPPNTTAAIIVDAGGIREVVLRRTVQDLGHEGKRIIKHDGRLRLRCQ